MKRFRDDRPSDICFARGTFNSHPYVMGTMNEFLRRLESPRAKAPMLRRTPSGRPAHAALNERLAEAGVPVRVANLLSIWTIGYTAPSRYHWMFQYYLRAEGLALSWVGSGRLIFSHNYSDEDFEAVAIRVDRRRARHARGWVVVARARAHECDDQAADSARDADGPRPRAGAGSPVTPPRE